MLRCRDTTPGFIPFKLKRMSDGADEPTEGPEVLVVRKTPCLY